MKLVIILLLAAAAIAQTSSGGGGAIAITPGGSGPFFRVMKGVPGGDVAGMPYSAEQVTEHIQTLTDGTHISQPSRKVMFYRDSLGRTRTERTFSVPPGASGAPTSGPNVIEISDPVGGVRYTLEPRNHVARKFPTMPPHSIQPNPAYAPADRLSAPSPPVVIPPSATSSPESQPQRPQISHESLGTQMIEGVLAEGSRTTIVYPIGAIGNDRPITTTSETWMSTELKTVVLSQHSDPRSGDSTTRLINISRAEPDPSLFQVPPDYEIIEPQAGSPSR